MAYSLFVSVASLFPDLLLTPIAPLFVRGSQFHWLTYAGALFVTTALYLVRRKRGFRFRAMLRLLFPSKLILHRSTLLDLQLYLIGLAFLVIQASTMVAASSFYDDWARHFLIAVWGPGNSAGSPSVAVTALTVCLTFLAIELGYWAAHFAMHRIPALWEFHKVHHSAEVLTPLTEWRQHPVELALFPLVIGAAVTLVQAPLLHAFGPDAQLLDLLSANLFFLAFAYTILHLRHTELPFCTTGWLGRLIQSPGHHQIHHSCDPRHYDRNLGFCLSLWDWAFGTLCLPERGVRCEIGLGEDDAALRTAAGSLLAPVWRAVASSRR